MRSLNTSLPVSASAQPPEQLLQAFKTAALSVTNLYKTALADQSNARHLGYQEALEDFRAFLDREKLALDDGDGQRIRKWVVSRIDGTGTTTTSDSDDEQMDERREARTGSSSPARKDSPDADTARQAPASTTSSAPPSASTSTMTAPPTFTFSAGPQWPTSLPEDTSTTSTDSPFSTNLTSPSVRLEVIPRGPRTPHRNNSRRNLSSTRDTSTTGSKRKIAFGDFFDIPDGFGGGKRGRFI